MAITYSIKPHPEFVLAVWDGHVGPGVWLPHLRRMLADPLYGPARVQLSDLRSADTSSWLTDEATAAAASIVAAHLHKTTGKRLAIVAPPGGSRPKEFEGRLAAYLKQVRVFSDFAAACTWLGLDAAAVQTEIDEMLGQMRGGEASASTPPPA